MNLPSESLPKHVAFIMDGNGRWAKRRSLLRIQGHEKGADSLREIARFSRRIGIREVTFYALSAENYERRPEREIRFLMNLLKRFFISERNELAQNNIRVKVIGDVSPFPKEVLAELHETLRLTAGLDGMVMRLALNYGSRQEILNAVRGLAEKLLAGELDRAAVEAIDENAFRQYLDDPEMTDPDLVIRTAGEFRLSNFLLWHSSYSEWWITERLWPEFDLQDLEKALVSFASRERKHGALGSVTEEPKRPAESPTA